MQQIKDLRALLAAPFLAVLFTFAPLSHAQTVFYEGENTLQQFEVHDIDECDDCVSIAEPIGFNFDFFGETHSEFQITTNGIMGFGDMSTAFSNDILPSPLFGPTVFPFWDDLHPSPFSGVVSGFFLFQTIEVNDPGNPYGEDVLVGQWTNYGYEGSVRLFGTMQVHLVADGRIVFNYNALESSDRSYGQQATIGLQAGSGAASEIQQFSFNEDAGIRSGTAIVFTPDGSGSYTHGGVSQADFWDMLLFIFEEPPEAVINTIPGDGGNLEPGESTLSWAAADRADVYRVLVSESSTMSNLLLDELDIVATSIDTGLDFEDGATYYWQVMAENDGGSTVSSVFSFQVASEAPPPYPVPMLSMWGTLLLVLIISLLGGLTLRGRQFS